MRRYTIIHPLYMSFFSKSLYKDVARNWGGLCLGYLLSMLALCLIPQVMTVQSDLAEYLNTEAPKIVRQFPTVTIKKGLASVGEPQPYYIRDEKTGKALMIIDTTGQIAALKGTTASILLTRKSVMVRQDVNETKTFDLSTVDDFTVGKTDLYALMDTLEEWFAVIIFPFALLISFVFHLIEVLIYAVAAALFLRNSAMPLPFRTLFRLAVISITPSMLAGTVLFTAGVQVPYWWLFSFFLAMAYLYYAVRVNLERGGTAAA
jgi:hypothetical protein